jgi:hypothetical protein
MTVNGDLIDVTTILQQPCSASIVRLVRKKGSVVQRNPLRTPEIRTVKSGPDGGTRINEAALVAGGFPYMRWQIPIRHFSDTPCWRMAIPYSVQRRHVRVRLSPWRSCRRH